MCHKSEADHAILNQVHTYSMFGQRQPRHFSLGAAVKSEGVASAVISGNVVVAQTVRVLSLQMDVMTMPRIAALPPPRWPPSADVASAVIFGNSSTHRRQALRLQRDIVFLLLGLFTSW